VLAALSFALLGCHAPLTQVVVVIESDLEPAQVVAIHVEIGPEASPTAARTIRVVDAPSDPDEARLPFSFGVRPRAGREDEPVLVRVAARDATGGVTARTRALVPFVRGETRRLVLQLERACRSLDCDASSLACRAGACVDPAIPPSALEPIAPGDELDELPPFPEVDAAVAPIDGGSDAGPVCTPACTPDETCTAEGCRCGARETCGDGALCEGGECVPWPPSCERALRGPGCDFVAIAGGTFTMGDEDATAEGGTGAFP
jgi:hypothetical protein